MQYETITDDRMLDDRRMTEQWSARIRTPLFTFACQRQRLAGNLQCRTGPDDDRAVRQL
jgi:hypothetical protein